MRKTAGEKPRRQKSHLFLHEVQNGPVAQPHQQAQNHAAHGGVAAEGRPTAQKVQCLQYHPASGQQYRQKVEGDVGAAIPKHHIALVPLLDFCLTDMVGIIALVVTVKDMPPMKIAHSHAGQTASQAKEQSADRTVHIIACQRQQYA